MTTQHTPGPWKVSTEKPRVIYAQAEGFYSLPFSIAEVPWTTTKQDEFKANAQLIASAPELLAALQDIQQMFNHDYDDVSELINAIQTRSRWAIEKATNS